MSSSAVENNFQQSIKNILSYMPSRLLIVFSAVYIIPLLSGTIDYVQMSIYLIAIQMLNLVCTTSSDGIGKIVLRFYEKYKMNDKTNEFFSSIFWLSIIIYSLTWILYIFGHNYITEKFALSNAVLLIVLFLVIPCGIRQFLYQVLRVYREPALYTYSIVFYQITFIILILTVVKQFPYANTVLLAMLVAVTAIDIYIIRKISLPHKFMFYMDKDITKEILTYSIPLFLTNACYWVMLNISKFIFQYAQEYSNTAITGVTSTFSNLVMQPLVTVFIFASFPVLVKKYEMRKNLKQYFTNLIQLFCAAFIPLICAFCFYSKVITNIIFPKTYDQIFILIPFYIIAICLHELTKLVNVKYHLKNIMHIELIIAVLTAIVALILNFYLIKHYGVVGAAVAMFLCEATLLFLNLFIKSKQRDP